MKMKIMVQAWVILIFWKNRGERGELWEKVAETFGRGYCMLPQKIKGMREGVINGN